MNKTDNINYDSLNRLQLISKCKEFAIKGSESNFKKPYKTRDEIKQLLLNHLSNTSSQTTNIMVSNSNIKKSHKASGRYTNNKFIPTNILKTVYPKVKKLVAIGDIHGDLSVAIKSLKLAGAIPLDTPNNINNINNIKWIGKDMYVVQVGDQIDRVRPSNWENNLCSSDDPELNHDEGSDLKIFSLFEILNKQAIKEGGAVLGILGNHELMNVVGDFRYVSPREFREFGNFFGAKKTLKKNNLPFGFKERKDSFKPGGILAKKLALTRQSVLQVGSWVFVHGGISPKLAKTYSLDDINKYIKLWLLGNKDSKVEDAVNELFHTDDDTFSPFWCRIYSDPEDWLSNNGKESFEKAIKYINLKNNSNEVAKGMIMGHTPQYMYGKGINSECNKKLWRIDIGASRAFGEVDLENNRKVQILVIENDNDCKVIKEK